MMLNLDPDHMVLPCLMKIPPLPQVTILVEWIKSTMNLVLCVD